MERYADMKPEEIADLFQAAQTISGVMEKHYGCTSVSVGIQDGPEAGQSIRVMFNVNALSEVYF